MKRNTLVLVVVLGVLLLVAVLVMQKPGEISSTGEAGDPLTAVDSLALDRIEINAPASAVVLQKKGVEWYLQEPLAYRADQASVASLVHDVRTLRVTNIVSNKPEKFGVFQVDSTGTRVRLFAGGKETSSFVLGKATTSYLEMYARREGSNDVLLVSGASAYVFSRPVRDWRDKSIVAVSRESIADVHYQYGDTTFVLAMKDSVWTIGGEKAQVDAVNTLLNSLASVQADDFVDTVMVQPPRVTAQIAYAGVQLNFFFIKQGEKYLVQQSGSSQWFEMQSWRASQLLKRKKDLTASTR